MLFLAHIHAAKFPNSGPNPDAAGAGKRPSEKRLEGIGPVLGGTFSTSRHDGSPTGAGRPLRQEAK